MTSQSVVNEPADWIPHQSRKIFKWALSPLISMIDERYPAQNLNRRPWLIQNLANIISTLRLPAGPILALLLLRCRSSTAYKALLASGVLIVASDGIDGEISRGLSTESNYGKLIDPLADKIFVFSMLFAHGIELRRQQKLKLVLIIPILLLLCIELQIVNTSRRIAKLLLNSPEIEADGASSWGKLKFGLECCSLIRLSAERKTKQTTRTSIIILAAIPCAYMSLRGYKRQLKSYQDR